MKSKLAFSVQYQVSADTIPSRDEFRRWVKSALQPDYPNVEITLRIVDMIEGLKLNQLYRQKPYATNVLTFDFQTNETGIGDMPLLGDIVLCAPVIAKEAYEQKKSLIAHYAHLTIHGVLHLQGYDHLIEAEAQAMEALEINILQTHGFTNPYFL